MAEPRLDAAGEVSGVVAASAELGGDFGAAAAHLAVDDDGTVAGQLRALADHVVVTSDNPRGEDPEAIMAATVAGMHGAAVTTDADRQVAIYRALSEAQPGDVVLLAGKGHETWQEINGVRHQIGRAHV